MRNSIVALNAGTPADLSGPVGIENDNLLSSVDGSTNISDGVNGDIVNPGALLGALRNNGGPTDTVAPQPGSPAIDAGDNATAQITGLGTDQRGLSRFVNGTGLSTTIVDIGAVEFEPPDTTTTLSVNPPSPVDFGSTVTLSAHVAGTGTSAVPQGTVTFLQDGVSIASVVLDAGGNASLRVADLLPGSFKFTASFTLAEGSGFGESTSADLPYVVGTATTTLTASASAIQPSQAVTLTAVVSATAPGSASPEGTVSFFADNLPLGSALVDQNGVAALVTTALQQGTRTLTATYNPSPGSPFASSSSNPVTVQVNTGTVATTTKLTIGPNPIRLGAELTLTASVSVSSSAGAPATALAGTVTFFANGQALGDSVSLNGAGQAALRTRNLAANTAPIFAVYSGDRQQPGRQHLRPRDPRCQPLHRPPDRDRLVRPLHGHLVPAQQRQHGGARPGHVRLRGPGLDAAAG